jgi:hypothetical protein
LVDRRLSELLRSKKGKVLWGRVFSQMVEGDPGLILAGDVFSMAIERLDEQDITSQELNPLLSSLSKHLTTLSGE